MSETQAITRFTRLFQTTYADENRLTANEKTLLVKRFQNKIQGVSQLVDALHTALSDDRIEEDEWETLMAPAVNKPRDSSFMKVLENGNWQHVWTRWFAARFGDVDSSRHADLAPQFKYLATVNADGMNPLVRQQLVTGLIKILKQPSMTVPETVTTAITILEDWQEYSHIETLITLIQNMKQISMLNVLIYSSHRPYEKILCAAYLSLFKLDRAKAETVWSLAEIVNFHVVYQNKNAPEFRIIAGLPADILVEIFERTENPYLMGDCIVLIFDHWQELTRQQQARLLQNPHPAIWINAFDRFYRQEQGNSLPLEGPWLQLTQEILLRHTDKTKSAMALKLLATKVEQDPGQAERLITQPIRWKLWELLRTEPDPDSLEQILRIFKITCGENDRQALLETLNHDNETLFLKIRGLLLQDTLSLEKNLVGFLKHKKPGQHVPAITHALRLLTTLAELKDLDAGTIALARSILQDPRTGTRETMSAITLLGIVQDRDSIPQMIRSAIESQDAGVATAANDALLNMGEVALAEVQKYIRDARFCFGKYLAGMLEKNPALGDPLLAFLTGPESQMTDLSNVVRGFGENGYQGDRALFLAEVIKQEQSPVALVQTATLELIRMNDPRVVPFLEPLFVWQYDRHAPLWRDELLRAIFELGRNPAMDAAVLEALQNNGSSQTGMQKTNIP